MLSSGTWHREPRDQPLLLSRDLTVMLSSGTRHSRRSPRILIPASNRDNPELYIKAPVAFNFPLWTCMLAPACRRSLPPEPWGCGPRTRDHASSSSRDQVPVTFALFISGCCRLPRDQTPAYTPTYPCTRGLVSGTQPHAHCPVSCQKGGSARTSNQHPGHQHPQQPAPGTHNPPASPP